MPTSTSFSIRIVAGASFAIAEGMMFDIHDLTNGLICVYNYVGLSESIGLPASASFRGPWNPFTTRVPMQVQNFGGLACSAGGGVGDTGVTGLIIRPLFGMPIEIVPFQTGFTAGATLAGAGMGAFSAMFPPVPAASAPFPHNV
jgi:hypothetical protein